MIIKKISLLIIALIVWIISDNETKYYITEFFTFVGILTAIHLVNELFKEGKELNLRKN